MKKIFLFLAVFLMGTAVKVAAQDAATAFKRANQQYVLFESERDKGSNMSAAYGYLLESYNAFMEVLDADNSQDYLTGTKNRLRSMYPYMLNATIFYSDQQLRTQALDYALAYVQIPKLLLFRDELLPRDDRYPAVVYFAGVTAYEQKKYAQALELFQTYLDTKTETQEKDCYVYMNLIYMAQKDYANQEAILEKAIEKYPVTLDFYYNLVNVHIATNNTEKLLATINRILAVDPNNEQVLPIKARLLERAGENMEAREIYQRLYTLYPNNFELLTGLARVNFNIATEIANSGLTIANDAEYALIRQRASTYLLEAQDLFLKILEKEPTSQKYMQGLAGVYEFMGLKAESEVVMAIIKDGGSYETFPARLEVYKKTLAETEGAAVAETGEKAPVPVDPAQLVIRVDSFIDGNNNRVIDAGESFAIQFTIENRGKGDAYDLRIRLSEQQGYDQYFDGPRELDGGSILAGESKQYTFRYIVKKEAPTTQAHINIYAFEANGFDAPPSELTVYMQEYSMPRLRISDHLFMAEEGTSIKKGTNGKLTLALQNFGSETARDVKLKFQLPRNIFPSGDSEITVDSIAPGEAVTLDYGFMVNNRFDGDSIAVMVSATESTRSSLLNEAYKVKVGDYLAKSDVVTIDGQIRRPATVKAATVGIDSELLDGVPMGAASPHRYALIIGNEDYSMTGGNAEINVPYAVNDAVVFREYCIRTFGIPDKQIRMVPNATAGMMREQLDWLVSMGSVDPEAELFFYYSGHGNNDEASKKPFLLPVDITGNNIDLGLSLDYLYQQLATYPIKGAYVFLDACFSGGYKSAAPVVARKGVRVVPKGGLPQGHTLSFSSSSGDQSSGVYHDKKQGYYTYFLLKTLKDANGDITLKELFDRTTAAVKRATAMTDKLQEPQCMVSLEWAKTNDWQNIVLKTPEQSVPAASEQPVANP